MIDATLVMSSVTLGLLHQHTISEVGAAGRTILKAECGSIVTANRRTTLSKDRAHADRHDWDVAPLLDATSPSLLPVGLLEEMASHVAHHDGRAAVVHTTSASSAVLRERMPLLPLARLELHDVGRPLRHAIVGDSDGLRRGRRRHHRLELLSIRRSHG